MISLPEVILRTSLTITLLLSADLASASDDFYQQCEKYYSKSDKFAEECLSNARPFSRTFYPSGGSRAEPEAFSAYFDQSSEDSRFILGCVLDFKHKISFAGVYYSHTPINGAILNNSPFSFIDFDGNVGLKVNGRQQTLLAIRQFKTSKIPARIPRYVSNCEISDLNINSDDVSMTSHSLKYRQISNHRLDEIWPEHISRLDVLSYFDNTNSPLVYVGQWTSVFVKQNGGLIINNTDKSFEKTCSTQKTDSSSRYNIVYEMCKEVIR